ncbi:glycosyltransferase family 87 protein [Chroococcus sp. FPU101]|uniref:glycosyltransferase family 87 protein n=1 Tax=Chroococcus sp. FPU101 TaxID=1974212 RepID=UPI001A8CA3EA|nr:glycosyltransferase family 87 protein [Chroococcus sp. FPU101]GFE71023.1 hypothetical protein CFPU101_36330 [Chroococcus sp. FPU101]
MNKIKIKKLKLNPRRILYIITFILLVLSLAYLSKGFYNLVLNEKSAKDLFQRWQEQQYIYQGAYPYDVGKTIKVDPKIGMIRSGGYPPWAFFTGFLFVPPISWNLTRLYFGLLNIISLVVLALFAFHLGKPYSCSKAWFSMAASLAISSHTTSLNNGQYGIIINAFLILMYWSLYKNWNLLAGLAFGVAMIKPNISALYIFVLLIRRRIKALISFSIYLTFATLVICYLTKLSPFYLMEGMFRYSSYFAKQGYSLINVLMNFGLDSEVATFVAPLLGLIVITIISYLCRNYSLLTLFAIASFVGRVWTYHRVYDNVMLIFLVFALLNLTFQNPKKLNIIVLSLLLITLWLPARITTLPYVEISQMAIWVISLVYLLIQEYFRLRAQIRI